MGKQNKTDIRRMNNKITKLIIKVTNKCNLSCSYCYYSEYSPSQIKKNNIDFDSIYNLLTKYSNYVKNNSINEIDLMFHGGEPTLLNIEYYQNIINLQKQLFPNNITINNSIQTNGVLLNNDWISFIIKNNIRLGISLDGPEYINDKYRKNKKGQGYKTVIHNINKIKKLKYRFSVLSVITGDFSTKEIFDHNIENEIYNFDFLPPLVNYHNKDYNKNKIEAINSDLFETFKYWIELDNPKINVRLFKSILTKTMGHGSRMCIFNNQCSNIVTIEPNGYVYPCDDLSITSFDQIYNCNLYFNTDSFQKVENVINERINNKKFNALPDECAECDVNHLCNGGCPSTRYSINNSFNNKNINCSFYKNAFRYSREWLESQNYFIN